MRKNLTSEWNRVGVKERIEYAILTDELIKAWSRMTTGEYKNYKGLKKENLRDNMTNMELVLNMLAEVTATELSKNDDPEGFEESKIIVKDSGPITRNTRKNIEKNYVKKLLLKRMERLLNC